MSDHISHHEEENNLAGLRPRERILVTARNLFRRHGLRGVSVDAIAEAALTNKMTLYRHFGSKDDLIVECLQSVIDESFVKWDELEADHPGDPDAQIQAWIETAIHCLRSDERGCEMVNAAVELTEEGHPARRVIEEGKKQHRDRLVRLCERAGLNQPELAADMLGLLFEGARVSRQSAGAEGPSTRFRHMAGEIIASFSGKDFKSD